ncbi:hypothetical protein FRC10_009964 [Ceratobasidium sp. 414]|nr:hypothetical protein FRC10_009964 [Ceratobasidium sp. 414]
MTDQTPPESPEASEEDYSEASYDEDDHKALLLGYLEEPEFDRLSLVDKILLDLAFLLAENLEVTNTNIKLHYYFEELDLSQPYQSRLGEAISLLEQGIRHISDNDRWKPHILAGLSLSLRLRFEHFGRLEDVDEAVRRGEESVNLAPVGDASQPLLLDILGSAHATRFEHLGFLPDINSAVRYGAEAVRLAPEGHKEKATFVSNLGKRMRSLALRLDKPEDLNMAIEYLSKAISLTPDGHQKMPIRLNHLGSALGSRFDRLGQVVDAEAALDNLTKALSLTPDGHEDQPSILNNLGATYARRYEHFKEPTDLENAINYLTKAVELSSDVPTDVPIWLHNLGNTLVQRFQRFGRLADIDKAIEYHHAAVTRTSKDDTWRAGHLVGLGNSYAIRFAYMKNVTDIEDSIDYYNEALSLTPDEGRSTLFNSLGNAHFRRFEHFHKPEDLDKAVYFYSQAALLVSDEHLHKSYLLSNLGHSYQARFVSRKHVSDLEQAILCTSQALSLVPSSHVSKRHLLARLASTHCVRFEHYQQRVDIDLCLGYGSEALSLTPEDNIDRSDILYELGLFHRAQFQHLGEPHMLQQSIAYFQQATRCPHTHPSSRFAAAWELCISMRLAKDDPPTLVAAYKQVMELLPGAVWLGSSIRNRYDNLIHTGDMPFEAAAAAIESNELELALEWLEAGSAVVWKQVTQLRTPFDELQAQHPALATRLKEVARQLDAVGEEGPLTLGTEETELGTEQLAQRRHRLAEEWDQMLGKVRLLPGFNNFMLPKKANELVRAARNGVIVVVNVHESRCDALILSADKSHPTHIPLPSFTLEKAKKAKADLSSFLRGSGVRTRKFKRTEPTVGQRITSSLGILWVDVVKPILDQLGYINSLPEDNLPHVTWFLTGPLVFLPLHAAGLYHEPQAPRTYKFVVSSYTPTAGALLSAQHNGEDFHGILAVAQPATPGAQPLPGTVAEISQIQKHAGHIPFTRLEGEAANATTVLDGMEAHSWVHLACHATQDLISPMDSAFILHESELNLQAIALRSLKHSQFAFLSACETATGDEALPEQAVHLAAGMMIAGYPSVIATMWSIRDKDGPVVAERVYAYMLDGGVPDSLKAARALHAAVGHLRNKVGDESFARWVPFIHIGL